MTEIQTSIGALAWEDILVIVLYFVFVLAVGLWSGRQSSQDSVSGYFLASRNMNWLLVGASLFASNIGSGHFVGLAGSGAASGIGIAAFELNALFVLMILGWLFVPVYMSAGVYTMPEYLKLRFGGQRIRVYLSVLALILYVFTKISADLFAGAIFIKQALGWDLYWSVILLLAVAALFTITGGLTAVIWTDFVQTILMLAGATTLTILGFNAVGGYEAVLEKFMTVKPNTSLYKNWTAEREKCSQVPEDSLHFFRDPLTSDLPWTGVMFGLTVSAVWYWCSDQVIVQRALAAKNMSHVKGGVVLAGYLKLLPLYLLVFPGMIARILFTDQVACADEDYCQEVCRSKVGCTNIAFPLLVINLMPKGLSGLMLAVMMAALMSSLTSIFNSSSTIFTLDIWTRFRKNPTEMELLIVGRLFILGLVGVSIAWIPIIEASQGSQLFVYIQSITSYLSPPVCAAYILAIFWTRTNEKGAFWGLMIGLGIGLIRFGLEFGYTIPACGSLTPDPRPEFVKIAVGKVHYLHFGCILFVISAISIIVISLLTKPIPSECLHRLTFWTRHSSQVRRELDDYDVEMSQIQEVATISSSALEPVTDKSQENLVSASQELEREQPTWRKILYRLCGFQPPSEVAKQVQPPALSPQEQAKNASDFLNEDPLWRRIGNGNAIVLMVIGVFMWCYYG